MTVISKDTTLELISDNKVWLGEPKVMVYKLTNISHYPLRKYQFSVKTTNHLGEMTKNSYVTMIKEPDELIYPRQSTTFEFKLDVPEDYKEMHKAQDGTMIESPMRTHITAVYTKTIAEDTT